MPLTPNGKIDKNKLPFPDTAKAKARTRSASIDKGQPATLEGRLVRRCRSHLYGGILLGMRFDDRLLLLFSCRNCLDLYMLLGNKL